MTSLLQIQKHNQILSGMIDDAIDLSNNHHGLSEFRLSSDFVCMLNIAFESWMGIILEIRLIVSKYPDKDYAADKWMKEYQSLACKIAQGFALFVQGRYAEGRVVLEQVYVPLQNIIALIVNQLSQYEV